MMGTKNQPEQLRITLEEREGYLALHAAGQFQRSEYLRIAELIREQALATGHDAVLADSRDVMGNPSAQDLSLIHI